MTIWKAIAIVAQKVGDFLVPCRHEWKDDHVLNVMWDSKNQVSKKMVQRCRKCGKYRRLKIW